MNSHYIYKITARGLKLLFTVSADSCSSSNGWVTFYKHKTEIIPHFFRADEEVENKTPVLSTRLPEHCVISTTEI